MNRLFFISLLSFLIFVADNVFAQHQVNIVPAPVQLELGNGFFQITEETVISVEMKNRKVLLLISLICLRFQPDLLLA